MLGQLDAAANARLDRLEQLLGAQLSKLASELRGDAYEMRYVGEEPGPSVGVGSIFPQGGAGSGSGVRT
jgi:hypothetical protein